MADHTAGDRARADPRHRRAGAEPHHHRRRRDRRDRRRRCARLRERRRACQPGVAAGAGRAAGRCAARTVRANPKDRRRAGADRGADATGGVFPGLPDPHVRRATRRDYDLLPTPAAMMALLTRAGFDVVVPEHLEGQCCGQPFLQQGLSRGVRARRRAAGRDSCKAERRARADRRLDLRQALRAQRRTWWSPTAPSSSRPKCCRSSRCTRKLPALAVHHNCSAQRMGEQAATMAIAGGLRRQRSRRSKSMSCCGFAGDKGLFVPELNEWATRFVEERYSSRLRHRRLDRLDLRRGAQRARRHAVRVAGKSARIRYKAGWLKPRCLSPKTGPTRSARISAPAAAARCSISARPLHGAEAGAGRERRCATATSSGPVAPLIDAHGDGRRRATLHARGKAVGYMQARSHDLLDIAAARSWCRRCKSAP